MASVHSDVLGYSAHSRPTRLLAAGRLRIPFLQEIVSPGCCFSSSSRRTRPALTPYSEPLVLVLYIILVATRKSFFPPLVLIASNTIRSRPFGPIHPVPCLSASSTICLDTFPLSYFLAPSVHVLRRIHEPTIPYMSGAVLCCS
ncbi:hypothetical protein C8J57DRAFT_1527385 [Mycena rebaudengoi]|nr:hypothetical protein C8J57DRAFT_1527385 [Mycena rebaudengoi]